MNVIRILIWSLLGSVFSLILTACSSTAVQQPADEMSSEMQADSEMTRTDFPSTAASRTSANLSSSGILNEQRLGTKWGDEIASSVTEVNLKRLSSSPIAETQ